MQTLPASLNNFYNKTVPCTNIWSQWCITALIAQETETFHPFTTERLRHSSINSEWGEFSLAWFALVRSGSLSAVLPSRPVLTATLHLGCSYSSALSSPQRLLQSPRHRRRTPAEKTWRRRSGVQAAGTSLQWVSRGRGEKWGRGEWNCGEGEGGKRGGGRGWSVGWKEVTERGSRSKDIEGDKVQREIQEKLMENTVLESYTLHTNCIHTVWYKY